MLSLMAARVAIMHIPDISADLLLQDHNMT
jgi:hypothetical protein